MLSRPEAVRCGLAVLSTADLYQVKRAEVTLLIAEDVTEQLPCHLTQKG
jgi:hypothetical protein